jgi:hypothetical protein
MTLEVRLAFLLFFFLLWGMGGLLPWTVAAVWRRGRGVVLALPLAPIGGMGVGVLTPLLGADDGRGFLVSLAASVMGGALATAAGIWLEAHLAPPPRGR